MTDYMKLPTRTTGKRYTMTVEHEPDLAKPAHTLTDKDIVQVLLILHDIEYKINCLNTLLNEQASYPIVDLIQGALENIDQLTTTLEVKL